MPQLGKKCRFTFNCLLVAILSAAFFLSFFLSFPVVAQDEIEQYNANLNEFEQNEVDQDAIDQDEGDLDEVEQYEGDQDAIDQGEGNLDAIHQDIDDLSTVVMLGSGAPAKSDDNLYGDILIGEDSGYNALYPVKAGDKLTFTFRLFFESIKKYIESIPAKAKPLILMELKSSFTVKLTLPEGMDFDATESLKCTFTDNDLFILKQVTIQDRTITADIELKPDKNTPIPDLKNAVKDLNYLDINVPAVSISAAAAPDTPLQCEGVFDGSFYIKYQKSKFTNEKTFTGPAEQLPAGRDYAIKDLDDQSQITYTLIVKPAPVPVPEEEQDILIPCPYPCQVPPMWNPQPQPSQMIQQVQPMPQVPVQNVDAVQAQAPIQLPKTGEKRPQPLSLFFLLSASALFLLRRKMR